MNISIIILIIASYLLGSISSAILISKFNNFPDPRSYGSKNPGATNILRKLGIKTATIVITFDIIKGIIPIWIGSNIFNASSFELGIITITTYLGHTYPIFFHFKGGKGVATALGSLMGISLDISGIIISIWTLITIISGYASLGTIFSSLIIPFYVWWTHPQFTSLTIVLSILILIHHHKNMIRLYKNQEQKIWKQHNEKKQ